MKQCSRTLTLALLLAACAVGPNYQAPPISSAALAVPRVQSSDSVRVFLDSLTKERGSDTNWRPPAELRPSDVEWLDILKDSALTNLVNLAIRQNPDLANARARIREFRATVGVARGPLFPTLGLTASGGRSQNVFGNQALTETNTFRITGDVAWELDVWGRTRQSVQAARADAAAEEAAERGTILSLVGDVALGYLQLLELDREHDIAEQTLSSRRATLALAKQRYAQGLTSELDVRQFEAQLAVPAVRLAQVEQARSIQEHALSALIGQTPTPIARGRALSDALFAVNVPDSLPSALLARRPDVQEAERDYAAATARVGVADAARLPAVAIVGSYGTQAGSGSDLFTLQTTSTSSRRDLRCSSSRVAAARASCPQRAHERTAQATASAWHSSARSARRAMRCR